MIAGIRTPAEVIRLALEDAGLSGELLDAATTEAEKRLAVAMKAIDDGKTFVGIREVDGGLAWCSGSY